MKIEAYAIDETSYGVTLGNTTIELEKEETLRLLKTLNNLLGVPKTTGHDAQSKLAKENGAVRQ